MDIIKQSKAAGKVEWANVKEQITVTSSYKPSVYFYLQFEWDSAHVSSPTPCRISKVEYADLNRVYGTTTKQFAGTLKYNLETGNSLYWDLNGDFYNNGTTTLSGGVSIGIGGSSTISFNASVTSGYYSGVCEQSKYRPAIHG